VVDISCLVCVVGLAVTDIEVFELNEAFASQAVYCVEVLGLPAERLNPGVVDISCLLCAVGLAVADIEVFELNEAFASQAVYCVEVLRLPADRVNPNGGAIALGHPLGCTGARQLATLLHELRRRQYKYVTLTYFSV